MGDAEPVADRLGIVNVLARAAGPDRFTASP
jgi:hypothetical protein